MAKKSQFKSKQSLDLKYQEAIDELNKKESHYYDWVEFFCDKYDLDPLEVMKDSADTSQQEQTANGLAHYFASRGVSLQNVFREAGHADYYGWDVYTNINLITNNAEFGSQTFGEIVLLTEAALFVWAKKVDDDGFALLKKGYGMDTPHKLDAFRQLLITSDFKAFCNDRKIDIEKLEFTGVPYLLDSELIKKKMLYLNNK